MLNFLFPKRLSQEEKNNIEYVRGIILGDIKKVTILAEKYRVKLGKEILMSVVYLQIFAAYLKQKKFKNLEQAWQFMNDIKGIIEKVFYVSNYIERIKESMKEAGESEDTLKPKAPAEHPKPSVNGKKPALETSKELSDCTKPEFYK